MTDCIQMLLAAVLLVVILAVVGPGLAERGLPKVDAPTHAAGVTFMLLAFVQVLSYGFHDPVLTDRAFITRPRAMVKGFILAGLVAGGFIVLFSIVGLYAKAQGLAGDPSVAVPAFFGLPMLLLFNAIMLTSAGSTLDSTFASTAKLAARDWSNDYAPPAERHAVRGRRLMLAIALLGNLPLLALYLPAGAGPGGHRRDHDQRHHGHGPGADLPARLDPPGRRAQLPPGLLARHRARRAADRRGAPRASHIIPAALYLGVGRLCRRPRRQRLRPDPVHRRLSAGRRDFGAARRRGAPPVAA